MIGLTAKRAIVSLSVAVALLALVGCEKPKEPSAKSEFPPEFLQKHWTPQEVPTARIYPRDYRLRAGDFLEIIYHVHHIKTENYRIKIQDVVVVRFPFNKGLNQVETVQSDGTLHLDLLDKPLYAFDLTIDEVHKELVKKYSMFVKDPIITVSFKESNVKIRELKDAIKTAPRGQSRLVPIAPDGNISLPFVVDIPAARRTITQLHRDLNQAYRDAGLEELEVTVNLQTIGPIRAYIMGEVAKPGVQLDRTGTTAGCGQITLLQAIAQAGSYIPGRAELSKVMLIRRKNLPRPQCAIINVFQLLENRAKAANEPVVADSSNHRYDIWLEDGDIVYVPTSDIAKRADYIEYVWTRGIRAVGGFTSSASYTAVDVVDWLGPNP